MTKRALTFTVSAMALAIGLAGVQTADAQQRKSLRWTTSQVGSYGYTIAASMAKILEQALAANTPSPWRPTRRRPSP